MKILFFVVDCLRADHLGCYGYPLPTSPNIDKLANQGVLLENAYATINQTDQSLTAIFSGLYPQSTGITEPGVSIKPKDLERLPIANVKFLPQIMQSHGFRTYGIDWLSRWQRWGYDYYHGCQVSDKSNSRRIPAPLKQLLLKFAKRFPVLTDWITGMRAEWDLADKISENVIGILRDNPEKDSFIMAHFWDPHTPFVSPEEFITPFKPKGDVDADIDAIFKDIDVSPLRRKWLEKYVVKKSRSSREIIAMYDGAISFTDYHIGRIVQHLKENNLFDDCIIIITGDHGENICERRELISHAYLYENVLRVPIVMHFPKTEGTRIPCLTSHVDIVPTLLDYLKISPPYSLDGKSVWTVSDGEQDALHEDIYFQTRKAEGRRGIRKGSYKYVERYGDEQVNSIWLNKDIADTELFNLTRDPEEKNNLGASKADVVDEMKKALEVTLQEQKKKAEYLLNIDGEKKETRYSSDEEDAIKKRLMDLGYVD